MLLYHKYIIITFCISALTPMADTQCMQTNSYSQSTVPAGFNHHLHGPALAEYYALQQKDSELAKQLAELQQQQLEILRRMQQILSNTELSAKIPDFLKSDAESSDLD